MENLFDGNYLKCEKNVKKFLKSLSSEEIKTFYDNIEYTPFPILLAREYRRRFPKKIEKTLKKSRKYNYYNLKDVRKKAKPYAVF